MARPQKTVFISYRRSDISWALAVYHYLVNLNYDVFFDYKSIPSGDFEQIIAGNIKARAHFLLILTPTALDRCSVPEDWLRREIETALSEKRNIIPLFFEGFNFETPSIAEKLSGDLENLKRYNGLEVPSGYFDEAMERLCDRYLNVTLDAILHPVSEEVQKVVKEQQIAADQAIARKEGTVEVEQIKNDSLLHALVQKFKARYWVYGRLLALALLLSGFFGPWAQVAGCNSDPNATPPSPQFYPGYQILYFFFTTVSILTIPSLTFLIMGIISILMLLFKKIRQNKVAKWLERLNAVLASISFGWLLILFRDLIKWGFYLSMSGIILTLINSLSEWISERRKAKRISPPSRV